MNRMRARRFTSRNLSLIWLLFGWSAVSGHSAAEQIASSDEEEAITQEMAFTDCKSGSPMNVTVGDGHHHSGQTYTMKTKVSGNEVKSIRLKFKRKSGGKVSHNRNMEFIPTSTCLHGADCELESDVKIKDKNKKNGVEKHSRFSWHTIFMEIKSGDWIGDEIGCPKEFDLRIDPHDIHFSGDETEGSSGLMILHGGAAHVSY